MICPAHSCLRFVRTARTTKGLGPAKHQDRAPAGISPAGAVQRVAPAQAGSSVGSQLVAGGRATARASGRHLSLSLVLEAGPITHDL